MDDFYGLSCTSGGRKPKENAGPQNPNRKMKNCSLASNVSH